MDKSVNPFQNKFPHIYFEPEALDYPLAKLILGRLPDAVKIKVDSYKHVFNRPSQDFRLQKLAPSIILAVKKGTFLYPGPAVCQDFGNRSFFYSSMMLNCLYDCDYCFLQGMYRSAYLVVFVNTKDFFDSADSELENGPLYLTVSYDTDLLALEGLIPIAAEWIGYARKRKSLQLEIRTKSANYQSISQMEPVENVILAWTLSPERVSEKYEKGAPSLQSRLSAARKALSDGWNVRLCFDPVIAIGNWKDLYNLFINKVFSVLPAHKIRDISLGTFRMPNDYLKKIRKSRYGSDLLSQNFAVTGDTAGYPPQLEKDIMETITGYLERYIPKERIYT